MTLHWHLPFTWPAISGPPLRKCFELTKTKRLPVSPVNIIIGGTFYAGAVACGLTQNWFGAILLLACGTFGLVGAVRARRADSPDIARLNAIEYRDERDRALAQAGFAAVGAAALIISIVTVVVAVIVEQHVLFACAQLFALAIVWGVTNSLAVKRN